MLSLTARRPLDKWNFDSIRPGPVGSVGDANVNVTFKSSLPGDYREAPYTKGDNEIKYGSMVQDGDKNSWKTNGQGARTIDGFFGGDRDSMTTQRGWLFQNLVPEDMAEEPIMGELPKYPWRNQVATINSALRTGQEFKDLPGGYAPVWGRGNVPRGGNMPGIVAQEGNTDRQRFTYNQDNELAGNDITRSRNPTLARRPGQEPNVNPLRLGRPDPPMSWNRY